MSKEKVSLDQEFSPLLLSLGQYEFFMAHGREGKDAMLVFLHMMYTARKQQTNQIYANNEYLRIGLAMGEKKVKAAKAFLKKKGLIDYIERRDHRQRITGVYIKLKYLHRKSIVAEAVKKANADV